MANNRMYLCCIQCIANENVLFREATFFLGKYYPQTGWYARSGDETQYLPSYNAWLEMHSHTRDMTGEEFVLIYESQTETGKAKTDLLRAIAEKTARKL